MALVSVTLPWGETEVEEETSVGEVLLAGATLPGELVAANVSGRLVGLDHRLEGESRVEPVFADSMEGEEVARRTAALLFHAICQKLYPNARVRVGQSLRGGYHYEVDGDAPPLDEMAAALNEAFHREAEAGRQVVRREVPLDGALAMFSRTEPEKARLLRLWRPDRVRLVSCLDFTDIRHGVYAINARCARKAGVEAFHPGLVLQFDGFQTEARNGSSPQTMLFRTYAETRHWNQRIGISTVADLNEACVRDEIQRVIQIAEGQHEKKIAELADRIAERRGEVRVVCVAGPSSSGKTTFVKRLSIQLQVNGINPQMLSLDDYYVDRDKTPRQPNGDWDFEALEAVDLPLFAEQLRDLVAGKEVLTPGYDFKMGRRRPREAWRPRRLGENEVLLVEGIHGLNPALTSAVSGTSRFRIFVSALTQLSIDRHNRIRTSDTRLLRRIVRDRRYRGHGAEATLLRWPSVLEGEQKHIFPFQEECDAMFNSALAYEPCIVRSFAQRYLLEIPPDSPARMKGDQLISFLSLFIPIFPEQVPATSILREFVGGSGFSYK